MKHFVAAGPVVVAAVLWTACGPSEPSRVRILSGGVRHESNTFSNVPTEENSFNVARGKAASEDVEWARFLRDGGVEIISTTHADSPPGGVVSRETYEKFKGEILEGARKAGRVDGVYLDLHGALHADGYEDAQVDLLRSLREIVGDDAVISASADLHGNISSAFADEIDVLTGYRTAPHVDAVETRVRAVRLLLNAIREEAHPVTAIVKVPILIPGEKGITGVEPLKSIYAGIPGVAEQPGLLDASIFVGMAWTDVPRASMTVTVVARGEEQREAALEAARALATELWEKRAGLQFDVPTDTVDGAIETALSAAEPTVFITDSGDNTTAGAAGDTTYVLERLLAKRVKNAVVAGIVDAAAVEACADAGVGERVKLSLGGKIDTINGRPFEVQGVVKFVSSEKEEAHTIIPGVRRRTGRTAVIETAGIVVAIVSVRRAFTAPEHFSQVGIDPLAHKIVVVKLGYLFAALREIAPRTIMALSPGFGYQAIENLKYKAIRRPIYPFDADMVWSPREPW